MSLRLRLAASLAVGLLAVPAVAAADVTVDSVTPGADGTAVLVLTAFGGCGEAPVTGLTLETPDEVALLGVTAPDGWSRVLDGSRAELSGPGVPAPEISLTTRIGAAPGGELVLTAEQQCADGTVLKSEPTLEASDEVIDPRMTVRIAPEVAPGATAAQVALAVGAFVLLVAALAEVAGRRSRRR